MRRRTLFWMLAVSVTLTAHTGAQDKRFVGTWVSASATSLNVTTMRPDGQFHTEQFEGLELAGTVEGRWLVRGNTVAWIYVKPPAAGEDVNPIVSYAPDRFTLRETDGSQSTFFRKGVVDPLAPEYLPVAAGTGWVLADEAGQVGIRVGVREMFAGQDCYRVEWITGPSTYQSEYWSLREDGIWVVGRKVLGRELVFERPYLLLGRTPRVGDKWKATLTVGQRSENVEVSVGPEEAITTPAGKFQAIRVTLQGRLLAYRRWYARGVGLVREEPVLGEGAAGERLNLKNLKRLLK